MPRRTTLYTLLGVPSSSSPSSSKFDPAHKYVTSPIFRNPFIFGALRLITGLYTLTTLIILLVRYSTTGRGQRFFSYFTRLSLVGLTAYFIASGVQTLSYASRWKRNGAGAGFALQRWPRVLQALHVVLYSTIVTYPFIVTISYWGLLSRDDVFESAVSSFNAVSVHILNLFFAISEIVFSNSPPLPWITLPFTILGLGMYLGVAYITYETQGFYVYSFLNPQKQGPRLAAYIIGIAVGQVIIFTLVHFIIVFRERLALRYKRVLYIDPESDDSDSAFTDIDDETGEINRSATRVAREGDSPGPGAEGVGGEEWEEVSYPAGQTSMDSAGPKRAGTKSSPRRSTGGAARAVSRDAPVQSSRDQEVV